MMVMVLVVVAAAVVAVVLVVVAEVTGHTFDPAADMKSESQSTHLRGFKLFQQCSNRAPHVALGNHPEHVSEARHTPWARAADPGGADRRGLPALSQRRGANSATYRNPWDLQEVSAQAQGRWGAQPEDARA